MTFDKLKAIIVEQFDVDEALVTPEADMQEDLGIDSLDVVDLIVIIYEAVDNIKTVGDIVAYIDSQQAE